MIGKLYKKVVMFKYLVEQTKHVFNDFRSIILYFEIWITYLETWKFHL